MSCVARVDLSVGDFRHLTLEWCGCKKLESLIAIPGHVLGSVEAVKVGLKLYLILIEISLEAVNAFNQGLISDFDPLVGDTACQIRSVMIAEIFNSNSNRAFDRFSDALKVHHGYVKEFMSNCDTTSFETNELLCDFISRSLFAPELSSEVVALTACYLLTKTKLATRVMDESGVSILKEATTPYQVMEMKQLSRGAVEKLIKWAQIGLSRLSIGYLHHKARSVFFREEGEREVVFEKLKLCPRNRLVAPCHAGFIVLMQAALKLGLPIVLQVDQMARGCLEPLGQLYMLYQPSDGRWEYVSSLEPLAAGCGLVFSGVSYAEQEKVGLGLKERIAQVPLLDLIFSCVGGHPQYPSGIDAPLAYESLERDRLAAAQLGTTRANPSLFLIQHIFPARLEN